MTDDRLPDEERSKQELIEELLQLRARLAVEQPPAGEVPQTPLRVRELLEQIPAFLWACDEELRLTWWRSGGTIVGGLDAQARLGIDIFEFFQTSDPEHPAILAHRAVLEGEARDYELGVEVEDSQRWLRAHVEPLRDSDGVIRGAVGVALDISERHRAESDRERLIVELRQALDQVKTLSGLIPICVHCKSMRDDRGYWQQVDIYVRDHSEAELSHGICPECIAKLLPERAKAE